MNNEWISIKERMPRNHRKVIIFDGVSIDFGAWHTKEFGWLYSDGSQALEVTHWMPMLKSPQGKTVRFTHIISNCPF